MVICKPNVFIGILGHSNLPIFLFIETSSTILFHNTVSLSTAICLNPTNHPFFFVCLFLIDLESRKKF